MRAGTLDEHAVSPRSRVHVPIHETHRSSPAEEHGLSRDGRHSVRRLPCIGLKANGVRAAHPMESDRNKRPAPRVQERPESLLAAEKRTLEMIANGASLSEVLNDLCAAIDAHAPAAAFDGLFDGSGRQGSCCQVPAPHVPAAFTTAITPWPIGPKTEVSCGTAAFTKQRVIIPGYFERSAMARRSSRLGSNPWVPAALVRTTHSKDGEVLGTFCVSYAEPRTPNIEISS